MKPILFNTDMVRAIMDGRKTVTRRVVKITVNGNEDVEQAICASAEYPARNYKGLCTNFSDAHGHYCGAGYPPYHPGDILYVRETWNRGYIDSSDAELCNEHWFEEYHKRDGSFLDGISCYWYRADLDKEEEREVHMVWRPSIHMPREAARIFLRVTDVRVERLQEIDAEDVSDEGLEIIEYAQWFGEDQLAKDWKERYARLWDSTLKPVGRDKYGWAANPWVWVVEFERCEKPEEDGNHVL